jgi:cystathionine gamma-synthase
MSKQDDKWENIKIGTKSVWSGETELFFEGATQVPIVQNVTFGFKDIDTWYDVALEKKEGHIYSRNTNPTLQVFEEKIRILEGAEAATSFATGMAAISNTLFTLLSPNQRVVSVKDTYGGTSKIFMEFLPRFNIIVQLCDTTDHEIIEKEIKNGCQVVYLESPTNPTLKIMDLKRLINTAHDNGAVVVVDNTFATPYNQKPIELGADLVVYSATKFLGGHADAMGGVVCGKKGLVKQIYHFREINGATLGPMSAFLLIRGLKTLEIRIQRHNENALNLANFLQEHPKVEKVFYPGLESHHNHEIAKNQMLGFGGVLSFSVNGGYEAAVKILPNLKFAHMAAHLGSVDTIVGLPKVASHVEMTPEERKLLGIPESLIRCSVGIENIEDIKADFEQALSKI